MMALSILNRPKNPGYDEAIENTIRDRAMQLFAGFGVRQVQIQQGEDHDGDPVINVVLEHDLVDQPIDFRALFSLDRQLRDECWNAGESRFVHIKHQYDEKQQFAEAK